MTKIVLEALNKQLNQEIKNQLNYIQISSWCSQQGLEGAKKFFVTQAQEEHLHMQKIYSYLDESFSEIIISDLPAPKNTFKNIEEVVNYSYDSEKANSQYFRDLYALAEQEKDYNTITFLQYFIEEQKEEENLFSSIIDKINLLENAPGKLYFIDQIFSNLEESPRA